MNSLRRQAPAVRLAWAGRRRHWLSSTSIRSLHVRRELPYPTDKGLGEFLPPAAVRTIVEWQDGLLERLNEQVKGAFWSVSVTGTGSMISPAGTKLATKTVLQTMLDTATDKSKTRAFDLASLALNNSFFMDYLVSIFLSICLFSVL